MAKWLVSRYGTHWIKLSGGFDVNISWSMKRNDPEPYRINVFGNQLGGDADLDAAKLKAENAAREMLQKALNELRGA